MHTTIVHTKDKLLKKYISFFLFIKNDAPRYYRKHVFYPNTNHCLGLYKGSKINQISEFEYSVVTSNSYHSYVTGIYGKPTIFHMNNVFDEICIVFEPLGLEKLTGITISPFDFLDSVIETAFSKKWREIYDIAYLYTDPIARARNLEKFILKNCIGKTKLKYIPFNEILADSVDQLTSTFNLSYRSIHRLYSNQLGLSPKEFLKIARFRKSINSLRKFKNQSQLAYEIGYADQSHLIREFKNLTGFTPKKFLKNSTTIENDVWWTIH